MSRLNRRQRSILKLLTINILLLVLTLLWNNSSRQGEVAIAVAKSKQMMDMNLHAAPALDAQRVQQIALDDGRIHASGNGADLEFVNAVRMSHGEARYWQDVGCSGENCAHATFYDYGAGGTVEAVVNLERAAVVGHWTNSEARPAGSSHVMPKALAIAAADKSVQNILGDIGRADPAMVPMSGWLADDDCADQWCVDLTYHDPNGTGRIFHVFVNMQQERVARTFYTRSRPVRAAAKPVSQRNAYTDGCNEQYGWEVCWEMTADDGLNFRDATYNGDLIFSSAKIGQVEAWYPSWPGGYRDEIGFSASVPPFDDTRVEDLEDSFEVHQLFTEFTHWPNCICCYRYEQIIRFYEDGRLDFRFVSHGPGCDDLSIYRPFWRIDVDLDGPDNDSVWLWSEQSWSEALEEFETYPVVDDISPAGYKLATFDEGLHYRWTMEKTDPLGLDEAYFFLLQFDEAEGAGPITTGPGDTFIPPRQWIDGDALSTENIVLWYVPLLNSKKGGPYWCMPDPEPAFSPCDAVLHARPEGELRQPTVSELEETKPTLEPTSESAVSPTPTATPAPTVTPRPLDGTEPEEILLNAGCTSCHQIGSLGEAHKVGPNLSNIGSLDSETLHGQSLDDYLKQSILDPNAIVAANCPNGPCLPNIMPRDYAQRLSSRQVDLLVTYLLTQQNQQRVANDEETLFSALKPIAAATSSPFAPKAFPAPKNVTISPLNQPLTTSSAVFLLLVSLVLLLGLLLYFKDSADDTPST